MKPQTFPKAKRAQRTEGSSAAVPDRREMTDSQVEFRLSQPYLKASLGFWSTEHREASDGA